MSLSGRQRGASRIALRLLRRRNVKTFSSSSLSSFAPRSNTTAYALSCVDERMCNDVKKRGDLRDHQMPLFGLGRSFAAAADASSVVARKKKKKNSHSSSSQRPRRFSASSSSSRRPRRTRRRRRQNSSPNQTAFGGHESLPF